VYPSPTFSNDGKLAALFSWERNDEPPVFAEGEERKRTPVDFSFIDTATGEILAAFTETTPLSPVALEPTRSLMAAAAGVDQLILRQFRSNKTIWAQKHDMLSVADLQFNNSGEFVLAHTASPLVRIWRVADGKLVALLESVPSLIRQVVVTPEHDGISIAFADGAISLWRRR